VDELRVIGELIHLGMSIRHGTHVRNVHNSAAADLVGEAAAGEFVVRVRIQTDVNGAPEELFEGWDDADLITNSGINGAIAGGGTAEFFIRDSYAAGTYVVSDVSDTEEVAANYADDFAQTIPGSWGASTHDNSINIRDSGNGRWIATRYDGSTRVGPDTVLFQEGDADSPAYGILPYLRNMLTNHDLTGATTDVDSVVTQYVRSYNGAINPFFIHLENAHDGPIRSADVAAIDDLTAGSHSDGLFVCVPGLELTMSPALIDKDTVQPEARDISFEDLWTGMSYLFESDDTLGLGKHLGSTARLTRAASPDFKTGAIHDVKSEAARTDSEILEFLHFCGQRTTDAVRNLNEDVVSANDESYLNPGAAMNVGITSLYAQGGFIDTAQKQVYLDDLDNLSKRNYQTTNEIISGQQSVGDAETTVYHRQLSDGTEHSMKVKVQPMSFGSYQHVTPADAVGNPLMVDMNIDTDSYCVDDVYTAFIELCMDRTREDIYFTHSGSTRQSIVAGTTSWVPFETPSTWEGLRDLMRTDVPASGLSNQTTTVRGEILSYQGVHTVETYGAHFMRLDDRLQYLHFLEVSARVYKRIMEGTGGLPYKANIQMQDLIDVNIVKQITFSTGSPAIQQMLEGMFTYLLDGQGGAHVLLNRAVVDRQLWNRDLHQRQLAYALAEPDLVAMMVPKTVDAGSLPTIIASSHILSHELGMTGLGTGSTRSPYAILPGAWRTIYNGFVSADGVRTDLAITLSEQAYDLMIDAASDDINVLPATIVPNDTSLSTASLIPGMRYYAVLLPELHRIAGAVSYRTLNDFLGLEPAASAAGSLIEGLNGYRGNVLGTVRNTLELDTYREVAGVVEPNPDMTGNVAPGVLSAIAVTYDTGRLAGSFTVDVDAAGVVSFDAPGVANGRINQLPDSLIIASANAVLDGAMLDNPFTFTDNAGPFTMNQLTSMSFIKRGNDADFVYHDRGVQIVLFSQDVFDAHHATLSGLLHELNGQMIVGPLGLVSVYGPKGDFKNSLRDILSIVGSGEKVSGDTASVSSQPDEVVSADDTSTPEDDPAPPTGDDDPAE
jgi:hypothetical protein